MKNEEKITTEPKGARFLCCPRRAKSVQVDIEMDDTEAEPKSLSVAGRTHAQKILAERYRASKDLKK